LKTKFKETEIGMIPEDWNVVQLSQIAEVIDPHPSHRAPKVVNDGFPFAGIGDINEDGSIQVEKCRKIGEDFVKQQEKSYQINENSIGYGRVGTVGKVVKLRKQKFRYALSPTLSVIQPLNQVDSKFVHSIVSDKSFFLRVEEKMTGTTRPAIGIQLLRKILIPLPPENERQKIAKIVSDLDSKIELNQNMNKNLEAIGKAIFKHWFVDFEFPNEEGKPYKSSGGEMIDSEAGLIPSGWKIQKIGSVLTTKSGGTPSKNKEAYWKNGIIGWINSGKVRDFRIVEPVEFITKEALEKSSTRLIPRDTTVIAITGATLGEVSFLEIDSCISQNVVAIMGTNVIPSEFIYFWIRYIINDLLLWQTGGAQQHINKNIVDNSLLLLPDVNTMEKYEAIIKPIFEKISVNCFETIKLTKIRDTLLPKLMSGKIRIPVETN